jgi:hypothetical protein
MDIKRYSELKVTGDVKLQKIEGKVFIVKKNYDPDTGVVKDPQILPIDKDSFLSHKTDAQTMIDAITVFLDDVDVLEKT